MAGDGTCVVVAVDGKHLVFIELQDVGTGKDTVLVLEVDGDNPLADDLPEIALARLSRHALRGQSLYNLRREVVGQQTAKVEDLCVEGTYVVKGKRVGRGQHTLRTVVGVRAVAVLEDHRPTAVVAYGVDTAALYPLHLTELVIADLRDKLEGDLPRQMADAFRHIE